MPRLVYIDTIRLAQRHTRGWGKDMGIKYRPEIDGLRTIAVLSVILYHAELTFFGGKFLSGGFLGVDVFFVISGFLITSLMMSEYEKTGTISISNFYRRRARRILPALFLVILVSAPFAWLYLLPEQLVDYSKSLISSLLFASNFYWDFSLQQYGAESSQLKPFLHTWSLAVEEQYYIVFPLLLFVIYRWLRSATIVLLAAGLIVSLFFAEWMTPKDTSFSFYMLPSRFWELLAGGILAHLISHDSRNDSKGLLYKAMPVTGMGLIVYSVFVIDFNASIHPGFVTLIPVIGTLLVISYANQHEPITRMLSSRLFVSIGLISYSLYLWHYPVFAFFIMEGVFDSGFGVSSAIVMTFVLSIISYKYIETVFRSKERASDKHFVATFATLAITIVGASVIFVEQKGFPSRMNSNLAESIEEMEGYRKKYWGDHSAYTNVADFKDNEISIEVIGNSWGQDIANALVEKGKYQVSFGGMTGHKCLAFTLPNVDSSDKEYVKWKQTCSKNTQRFQNKLTNTDLVVLADNKTLSSVGNRFVRHEITNNINLLRKHGYLGPVVVIANRPTYKKQMFEIFHEFGVRADGINAYAQRYLRESYDTLRKQDTTAKEFYEHTIGVNYFSLVDLLCDSNMCKVSNKGMPLYYDTGHLTLSGAQYVSDGLSEYIDKEILDNSQEKRLLTMKTRL